MAADALAMVRAQVASRVARIRSAGPRLSSRDLHAQLETIRRLAADHGLGALEGLARCSAQRALLPGHRVAVDCCLEHVEEALDSRSDRDCAIILAALAVRLH